MIVNSDFWGNDFELDGNNSSARENIARKFNSPGMEKDKELLLTLLGVAPGQTASASRAQIEHNTSELGGVREISTISVINRASTNADVTDLTNNILTYDSKTGAYATDKAQLA